MSDFKTGQVKNTGVEEHIEAADLHNNLSAKIKNPLHGIPRERLLADTDAFVRNRNLGDENIDLFRRAALVAQFPGDFDDVAELNEEERFFLRKEQTHRWSQSRTMYLAIILCSVGAAVQGWDQTGSNGANISFPQEFGITSEPGNPDAEKNEWILGIVNSSPYFVAAMLGCWLTDPINSLFGRRGAIFISGVFCFLPVIGQGLTQTWEQLLVCRMLLGIGMGLKAASVPIFGAENAPASIRGALVMTWQLWTAFGIMLGTAANLALSDIGKNAWRLQLGSACLPAIPLMLFVYMCPESPRWLMKKGRYPAAFKSFLRLRTHPILAARDMVSINAMLEIERQIVGESNFFTRFFELFTIPRNRRATVASAIVMLAQQMCGINIIAFYSTTIFVNAGYTPRQALLCSFGFGIVNFVFAFPALFTIDTFGRRALLLFTFPNMAWTLLTAGLLFLLPIDNSARVPAAAFFIFFFAAFYSPGEGPVPFTYSAEAFPLSHREVGMAWAVATCLFWAGVLGISLPRLLSVFSPTGVFGFYAGLNLLAFVMIFLWLPETKQRTLEELDFVFAVPMSKHAKYQVSKALPYFFSRYVFRNKNAHLEPLYDFGEVVSRKQFAQQEQHASSDEKIEA